MIRWTFVVVTAVATLGASAPAWAHGGQYSPPSPPIIGSPKNPAKDPGPPPPPPERTPDDVFGPETPRDRNAPATAETPAARDAAHWTRWWYANRTAFVGEALHPAMTGGRDGADPRRSAIGVLTPVLRDPNPDLASGACIALGRVGDASAAAALVERLRDRAADPTVREAAALGLGLLPPDAASAPIGGALTSVAMSATEPVRLRSMAVYALGVRRDATASDLLRDLAGDAGLPLDLSCAARTAIGLGGDAAARADLEALLVAPRRGGDEISALREAYAAHGLARLADVVSVPALRKAAGIHEDAVRSAALLALGTMPSCDDDTARLLVARLRDVDPACRNAAALSLGRSGHKLARAALEEALRAKDGGLRCHAALGLGLLARRLGDPSAAGAVPPLLKDRSDRDLRGAAAVACGLAHLKSAAPDLRDIAGDDVAGEPRAFAAVALGMIGDADSIPILHALVRNTSLPVLPFEAATALGLLGDTAATADLRAVFADSQSIYVQGNAAVALGRIGGPAAAEFLTALVRDEQRPGIVRGLAAVGLGLALGGGRGYGAVAADLPWGDFTPTVTEIASIL